MTSSVWLLPRSLLIEHELESRYEIIYCDSKKIMKLDRLEQSQ